jgi:hypothetical protein
MTNAAEPPRDDTERTITISSFGLTGAEQEALFDRVATAAHALSEQVTCFGSVA